MEEIMDIDRVWDYWEFLISCFFSQVLQYDLCLAKLAVLVAVSGCSSGSCWG